MPAERGAAMESYDFIAMNNEYVFNTYGRTPVMLVEGAGCKVTDSNGRTYLDFIGGLAACCLGHGHEALARAISEQAKKLIHVSNLFYIEPQIKLAKLLTENSFAEKVFFCNSGAEANEAAIKLARKYFHDRGEHERYQIITMEGSFHGRTLATLGATGQTKYRQGFEPVVQGFSHVPFGDIKALEQSVSSDTAAIMIEPIQGEGGVRMPPGDFFSNVRTLCNDIGCLLILDEVQTGMGRTGKFFAYEHFGITPDVMTLAKGIAGGVPMGALLATNQVAKYLWAGNPRVDIWRQSASCGCGSCGNRGNPVKGLPRAVYRKRATHLRSRLEELARGHELVREVRGLGLMQAIDLKVPGADFADCHEGGRRSGQLHR